VDTLLNPCNCSSVWRCKCLARADSSFQEQRTGLDALVCAATMTSASAANDASPSMDGSAPRKSQKHRSSRPGSRGSNPPRKRPKDVPLRGPELPPILPEQASSSTLDVSIPNFETMPPLSMFTSLAGSGCTCGLQCACPGCVEHRGSEHASKERRDCADGCGTCVDHSMGLALPGMDGNDAHATDFLGRFFARAAALPAPPPNRRVRLDPMDVTVYPDAVRDGVVFGLVNLPKLKCCGGRCRCTGGVCGCGKTCDGCCEQDAQNKAAFASANVSPPKRSCCSV